jgi:subtilisin family serine protease
MFNTMQRMALVGLCIIIYLVSCASVEGATDPRGIIINDKAGVFDFSSSNVISIDTQYIDSAVCHLLDSCGVDSVRRVFPNSVPDDTLFTRPDGVIVKLIDLSHYYKMFFTDSTSFDEFDSLYRQFDSVSSLEPELFLKLDAVEPTDPFFLGSQRYLQDSNIVLGGINATGAWDITTGDTSQVIGFVDSGIDDTHDDLIGKLAGAANASVGGSDVTDVFGHGTFVSGIMAANTNGDYPLDKVYSSCYIPFRKRGCTL